MSKPDSDNEFEVKLLTVPVPKEKQIFSNHEHRSSAFESVFCRVCRRLYYLETGKSIDDSVFSLRKRDE